ncbi:hypothetical protein M9Y10_034370 [Tritrichomonas musculus]|uniref:Uncharacterized protein n=1 Tax=Tritrichomonas musculus TaxID=1915356 RepID=A0ABR2KEQ5_9EUKA
MSSRASRTPSYYSSSRTPSTRPSRSHSTTPSSKSFNPKITNLLYVYIGLAVLFLFAILSHLISPLQMKKMLPVCSSFRNEIPMNPDIYRSVQELIANNGNITKSNILNKLNEMFNDPVNLDEVNSAIKSLHYYEDEAGALHNCYVPINTGGFLFVAILLFIAFSLLAAMSYFNKI